MKKNIYDTLYLDRDGVINHKINGYVQNYSQLKYISGVLTSISKLSKHFERIFVVTNQQGIGKKIMTINELNELHSKMLIDIKKHGDKAIKGLTKELRKMNLRNSFIYLVNIYITYPI